MKLSLSIVVAVALLIGTLILMTCSEDKPTTPTNRAPSQPQIDGPSGAPTHNGTDVSCTPTLWWTCSDPEGGKLTYDVRFGESTPPSVVSSAQSGASYSPATLDYSTKYYWGVVAKDPAGKSTNSETWSFTTVAQSPHIALDKTTLSYTAVQNGGLPGAQTFTITNAGGGTLNWSVADDADWLTMSPTSGVNNSASITVSVNSTNLSPITYTGTITVSSSNADNSPQTIAVTYSVASAPHIALDKSTLNYTVVENGSLPASQTFAISNTGGGTLNWSASSNVGWLTVSPSSGNNNSSTITVSVNTSNLSPNIYYGMITVSSTHADNSPQTIAVEYLVNGSCDVMVMEPSSGDIQDVGTRYNVLWTSSNAGLYVKFELYKGVLLVGEISSSIVNDGGGSWECKDFGRGGGPDYRIKVSSLSDPTCSGYSDFFTIIVPTQTVYIEFNTTSSGVSFSSNYWSGLIYFMHTDLAWRYAAPSWNGCGGSLILEGGTSDFDEITCVYPSECMICTDDGLTISSSCTSVSVAVRADLEVPVWSNVYTITSDGGGCKRSMSFNSSCVTRTTSISNSCLAPTGRTRLNICQEDFLPVGDTEAAIESIRYTFNGWRVPAKAAPFQGEVIMVQGANE